MKNKLSEDKTPKMAIVLTYIIFLRLKISLLVRYCYLLLYLCAMQKLCIMNIVIFRHSAVYNRHWKGNRQTRNRLHCK